VWQEFWLRGEACMVNVDHDGAVGIGDSWDYCGGI